MVAENKEVILDYIYSELRRVATNILPNRQKKFLPPDSNNFHDDIYIIEKFLSTRVLPTKYNVNYSSKLKEQKRYQENIERIETFVSYLKEGDMRVNVPEEKFLPPSYKSFLLSKPGQSERYRYRPDYLNDFYGIRHAHLNIENSNELLFYVLVGSNAYLLCIGGHNDFYNETVLTILVEEFDFLLNDLRIMKLEGIRPGIQSTEDKIQEKWSKAVNEFFVVNGIRYAGMPMNFTRSNMYITGIEQNLFYQIDTGLKNIEEEQNKRKISPSDQVMTIMEKETSLDRNNARIHLTNTVNSFRAGLQVSYLKIIFRAELTMNKIDELN